ncbi:MAG: hypothetical protein ACREF3_14630, partial [Acetobacteraceae bacterium]
MGMGMRVLTALTVAMGVLILVGTTVLVVTIVRRSGAPPAAMQAAAVVLNEPAGTRIAGIAAVADRLAVELQGGGPDRVVLVDPRSG